MDEKCEWKNYLELKYKISDSGLVWSIRRKKYIIPHVSNEYNVVLLCQEGKSITRRVDKLVAQCFNMETKDILVHLNKDNLDNDLSNLKWLSLEEYFETIGEKGEKWKETEYQEYYVSSMGKIWSRKSESFMALRYKEYVSVSISKMSPHVHVLAAKAFIPILEGCNIVNHKDGDGTNNIIANLEWVTCKGNADHARHELKKNMGTTGMKRKYSPKPADGVKIRSLENYLVTPEGKVYSLKSRMYLTETTCGNKYPRVSIGKTKYFVHKLVGHAYLSPPSEEQTQVNHIDGNKSNNHVDNLEWVTGVENMKHCAKLHKETFNRRQKPVIGIDMKTKEEVGYDGVKEAARNSNVNSGSIIKACKGQRPSAGGYLWKYK